MFTYINFLSENPVPHPVFISINSTMFTQLLNPSSTTSSLLYSLISHIQAIIIFYLLYFQNIYQIHYSYRLRYCYHLEKATIIFCPCYYNNLLTKVPMLLLHHHNHLPPTVYSLYSSYSGLLKENSDLLLLSFQWLSITSRLKSKIFTMIYNASDNPMLQILLWILSSTVLYSGHNGCPCSCKTTLSMLLSGPLHCCSFYQKCYFPPNLQDSLPLFVVST